MRQVVFVWFGRDSNRGVSGTQSPADRLNALQWRRNEQAGVSNHQPHECLLNPCAHSQPDRAIQDPAMLITDESVRWLLIAWCRLVIRVAATSRWRNPSDSYQCGANPFVGLISFDFKNDVQGPFLLTWFNLNSSMIRICNNTIRCVIKLHPFPNFKSWVKQFYPTLHDGCNCLSKLIIKGAPGTCEWWGERRYCQKRGCIKSCADVTHASCKWRTDFWLMEI